MSGAGADNGAFRARQRAGELAARLPPLLVAARQVAATVAQGVHGRRRVGSGESFWQFRRYQVGDSAARIDWRQSAKTQPLFVRENEWEAAQSVWLWCDHSASMEYRSAPGWPGKRERAEILLLALAELLVRGGERVALLNRGGRPESGRQTMIRLAERLTAPAAFEGIERGRPAPESLPRFSRVVLIGDFMLPLPELQAAIAGLSRQAVSGHLLQVLDPAEESLPFEGRVSFADLEEDETVLIPRVEALRPAYQRRLAAHRDGLATLARAAGWTYASHRTDHPPEAALLALYHALARDLG
jgi:uncharacterized protein (DUF58 family)